MPTTVLFPLIAKMVALLAAGVITGWLALQPAVPFIIVASVVHETEQAAEQQSFDRVIAPLLGDYCLDCHTDEDAEGGVDLSRLDSQAAVEANLELWQAAVQAIESGYMPPQGESQPAPAEIDALQHWHVDLMRDLAAFGSPRSGIRRLNRHEYENTVRDLFRMSSNPFDNPSRVLINDQYFQPATRHMPHHVMAISYFSYGERKPAELPGLGSLPADPPVEHGFNNDATTLSCSPLQIEACFEIAQQLLGNCKFPGRSESWDSLFVANEGPAAETLTVQAAKRLANFLPRAFRRPTTDEELQRYVDLFDQQYAGSGSFTESMTTVISAILVSPRFLFRQDLSDSADDYAIASRLSYFLWGSMPDDTLLQAAREGRLSTEKGVRHQVQRMICDPKVRSLSTDFGMQWLKTHKAALAQPDPDVYPHYYLAKLSPPGVAMMIEQMLLFETILVEDRSILDFIDADFAYLNRNLMDWYGLPATSRPTHVRSIADFEDFFRVTWPDQRRGGVLTSGAMLVATSATTRTSPVSRGAWVLDVIFNRPPPPPPADVPSLEQVADSAKRFTNIRTRFEHHRRDPTCAVCHDRIDPVGFAFEQFNAVAQLRTGYADGSPVDASGEVFGQKIAHATDLKQLILRDKRRFVTGFVEHMLKYALGRSLHPTDEPEIQRIVDIVMENDCRFSVVVEEIAAGSLFRGLTGADPRFTHQPGLTR
ncbi:MAG: DUF1592 domain-containing protein [Pirellulaceae bacterium]